jgi:uncharacterized protein (DUF58 family)
MSATACYLKMAIRAASDQLKEMGREVNVSDLESIVMTHACSAAVSAVAAGSMTGIGSTIATTINLGFVVAMYIRLGAAMGIGFDKGMIRALASAVLAEIAAVLAFSALINNDKVGALFFSDKVEKFIPPKKGRSHLLHIIREIIEFEPTTDGTDISEALRYLTNAIKKKCAAFLLSDMLDVDKEGNPNYEEALKVAVNRHDLSVIEVYDPRERSLPSVGMIHIKDSETGDSAWVNTSSKKMRRAYEDWFRNVEASAGKLFMKYNVDKVSIALGEDYVKGLMTLFKNR